MKDGRGEEFAYNALNDMMLSVGDDQLLINIMLKYFFLHVSPHIHGFCVHTYNICMYFTKNPQHYKSTVNCII